MGYGKGASGYHVLKEVTLVLGLTDGRTVQRVTTACVASTGRENVAYLMHPRKMPEYTNKKYFEKEGEIGLST
jgi:hypothetical protein